MQPLAGVLVEANDVCRPVHELCCSPLLELDHDVRRPAGARMHTREDDIGPLAGQRKLVLDKSFDPVEPGLDEITAELVEAPLPRLDLPGGWAGAQAVRVLLRQRRHERSIERSSAQLRDGRTKERHDGPQEGMANQACGWGLVEWRGTRPSGRRNCRRSPYRRARYTGHVRCAQSRARAAPADARYGVNVTDTVCGS